MNKELVIQTMQRILLEVKDQKGRQAWQQQIQIIQQMSESEFKIYIQKELAKVPHTCDFCDWFSGNRGIPRISDFGFCYCVKSVYYQKAIHENSTCPKWQN